MPLKIEVEPDIAVPTEFTMTYEYPPFEPNFTPEGVVLETSGGESASISAVVNGNCLEGSPCGTFDASKAAHYAEYWGDQHHDRNPYYHDFKAENCTNFLSQIMARGGMSFMHAYKKGEDWRDGSWWYIQSSTEYPYGYDYTDSWAVANILPRHLWQYGLAVIDSSNEPSGWTQGDILAEDAYDENGNGDFNHLQFVVGTQTRSGHPREPLIANESEPEDANYSAKPWRFVKERIEKGNPEGWNRVPLAVKHTVAVYDAKGAKKHDPDNLYGPNGVFGG